MQLMSPEYVRPYVKAQKNADRDAEAIAVAATRPTMKFVAPKSEAQLDLQRHGSALGGTDPAHDPVHSPSAVCRRKFGTSVGSGSCDRAWLQPQSEATR